MLDATWSGHISSCRNDLPELCGSAYILDPSRLDHGNLCSINCLSGSHCSPPTDCDTSIRAILFWDLRRAPAGVRASQIDDACRGSEVAKESVRDMGVQQVAAWGSAVVHRRSVLSQLDCYVRAIDNCEGMWQGCMLLRCLLASITPRLRVGSQANRFRC